MTPALQLGSATEESTGLWQQLHSQRKTDVLFALTREERQMFFPDTNSVGRDALPDSEWIDADGLISSEKLAVFLNEKHPRVLVTGWSTPLLSPKQTSVAGGPVDYVCHVAGSVRQVVPREAIARGLMVTNWGTIVAAQVAEHAVLLILAALRNLSGWQDYAHRPLAGEVLRQKARLGTRSLHGKRVGIHGFGQIAREIMKLLAPFDVRTSVFSAGVPIEFISGYEARPVSSLRELAASADVFVECEALTEATRLSVNADVLAMLPDGAVFVNVGRGAVVDELALAEEVRRRGLRVASDVFVEEPHLATSPLCGLPGAFFSPHIAGPVTDAYPTCGLHALRNIHRYLGNQPPNGLITLEIFDRST